MSGVAWMLLAWLAAFASYAAAYAAKRRLAPSPIPLAEGVRVLLGLAPFAAAAIALLAWRGALGPEVAAAAFALFVLTALVFVMTVPAVFDRSISLQLLAVLDRSGPAGIDEDEAGRELLAAWFEGDRAVRKRLGEQVAGGYAEQRDGRYRLTRAGRRFLRVARLLNRLYRLDPRIVRGGGDTG